MHVIFLPFFSMLIFNQPILISKSMTSNSLNWLSTIPLELATEIFLTEFIRFWSHLRKMIFFLYKNINCIRKYCINCWPNSWNRMVLSISLWHFIPSHNFICCVAEDWSNDSWHNQGQIMHWPNWNELLEMSLDRHFNVWKFILDMQCRQENLSRRVKSWNVKKSASTNKTHQFLLH